MYTPISCVLLGIFSLASSHMIMKTPTPFSASKFATDNGPLSPDGSNFPCKFGYDTEGANNIMPLGSTQELSFIGGASHGGGSCQVSITYDSAPTASSKFKVIHSIIGGCPSRNTVGNIGTSATAEDPDKYEFSIPNDLPAGKAVLAWTWFNKIGNREMYMNCAPVTLTGGSSTSRQRSPTNATQIMKRGMEAFEALPDMFVANIGNGCSTKDSADVQFDQPGKSVDIISSSSLAPPVGNCAKITSASDNNSGVGSGSSSNTGSSGSSSSSNTGSSGSGSSVGSSSSSNTGSGSSSGVNSGSGSSSGVNSGSSSSTGSSASNTQPNEASSPDGGSFNGVSPSSTPSTSASGSQEMPDAQPAAAASSDSDYGTANSNSTDDSQTSASSPAPTNSKQNTVGSSCSSEGQWNCVDGQYYQRCASGTWSAMMPVADGTRCQGGSTGHLEIMAVRNTMPRLPRSHLRRHLNNLKFR